MSDKFTAIAIDELDRTAFERFAQFVLQVIYKAEFIPTGGLHDGGLDGYFQFGGSNEHFFQASKQETTSTKIRSTIRDIRKHRSISQLTYATSQIVPDADIICSKVLKDLGVQVTIYDRNFLTIQCDFYEEIASYLYRNSTSLKRVAEMAGKKHSNDMIDKTSVLTYMEMEALSLQSAPDFNLLCIDSVIYEALEGTDPDKYIFKDEQKISDFFANNYPKLLQKKRVSLSDRLQVLSSKSGNPRIRKHPKDQYSLPHELRDLVGERNASIKSIQKNFLVSLNERIKETQPSIIDDERAIAVDVIHEIINRTYQQQAINFSSSIQKSGEYQIEVFEIFDAVLGDLAVEIEDMSFFKDACLTVFRHACYSSNEHERLYLEHLLRYYTVKFVMSGDATVDNYFSQMAKNLRLYIGSDIVVRMLSETYIKPDSRAMTKCIGLLASCGVRLFITRQSMEEVYNHVKRSHLEFVNNHEKSFKHVSIDEAKNFSQILIRAFYYAYLEPDRHDRKPRDWHAFISNFGGSAWYESNANEEDSFGTWLSQKFPFKFIEKHEVVAGLDKSVVSNLTSKILEIRDHKTGTTAEILAQNDAEMMTFINFQRVANNERVSDDLYGINSWWLTEETIVLRAARALKLPDDTIMNPQFLMNRYFLDPTIGCHSDDAQAAMPSIFGLRITDRLPPEAMKRFLEDVEDIADLDEPTKSARVVAAVNKLKRAR